MTLLGLNAMRDRAGTMRGLCAIGLCGLALNGWGCRRSAPPKPEAASVVSAAAPSSWKEPAPETDAWSATLWERAREGEADDLARLAQFEGSVGLVTHAQGERRKTALLALAYADDLSAAAFLADAARKNEDADLALDVLLDLLTRPRRAVDPEDALEIAEACQTLRALVQDKATADDRRVRVERVLSHMRDRRVCR